MTFVEAPGLPADWLNGWLAAIGVTVLVPVSRLSWSEDATPTARFYVPEDHDLVRSIATRMATTESLASSTIARHLEGAVHQLGRKVSLAAYAERSAIERRLRHHHLAASASDLVTGRNFKAHDLPHGAFDPPAPRGETLWSRAVACADSLGRDPDLAERVRSSLAGSGRREQLNGLGFDGRRLSSGLHGGGAASKVYADPVVELLCLEALALFPTRGNGRIVRQRGWLGPSSKRRSFQWIAWRPSLDRWAIDALLDSRWLEWPHGMVVRRYEVVPYQPGGASDTTRAYFSAVSS